MGRGTKEKKEKLNIGRTRGIIRKTVEREVKTIG